MWSTVSPSEVAQVHSLHSSHKGIVGELTVRGVRLTDGEELDIP